MERIEEMPSTTLTYRIQIFRDRALARKGVIAQEAEIAEAGLQLASLNELATRLHDRLTSAEQNFAGGRVFAPISGIVSTNLARVGQSLVAGTPIAEILDPSDVYVDWYIPNERFADPQIGKGVLVLFGNWRFSGTITEILPVSDVFGGRTDVPHARARRHANRAHSLEPGQRYPRHLTRRSTFACTTPTLQRAWQPCWSGLRSSRTVTRR